MPFFPIHKDGTLASIEIIPPHATMFSFSTKYMSPNRLRSQMAMTEPSGHKYYLNVI